MTTATVPDAAELISSKLEEVHMLLDEIQALAMEAIATTREETDARDERADGGRTAGLIDP